MFQVIKLKNIELRISLARVARTYKINLLFISFQRSPVLCDSRVC